MLGDRQGQGLDLLNSSSAATPASGDGPAGRNWAGSYAYRATRLHRPASLAELQRVIAAAGHVHVLGSRHSFNDIADSTELIDLCDVAGEGGGVVVDRSAATVTCGSAMTYGQLALALDREGLALANMASLPHISVGGAIATATHGSGDGIGNLATAVTAIELVTSSGDVVKVCRGDDDFDGTVVGLGALGAVTRVTLDVEPTYDVAQTVYEGVDWDVLLGQFDAVSGAGYSVSVFTRWGPSIDQVWVKDRVGRPGASADPSVLLGGRAALGDRHPVAGADPRNCTAQGGVAGPWWDRLPHFRNGFVPSNGDEIQSEMLVPRRHAVDAIRAMRSLAAVIDPHLLVSEIRTVAADSLWMSPQYGTDTIGIHCTWKRDAEAVQRVLVEIEAAMAPFDARPHWAKMFLAGNDTVADRYPRRDRFVDLVGRFDPRGAFTNPWLRRHVLGDVAP